MNIKNRQQLLTILAAVVVAFWLGDKLLFSPLVNSWKARSTDIVELRKRIAQGNQLLTRDRVIRDRWNGMRTNTLPSTISAAEAKVYQTIERWAQDSGISITSVRPQWKRNADDYMTLECRVDASGNMQRLSRFIYNLEKDPTALRIEGVDIASRDNDGQQLNAGIQVSGLLLNPPE